MSQTAPFLCVVIPAYNCEKYLEHCVTSVLSQPSTNIKIVIVDDGSTDNTLEIATQLSSEDPRIYVIHQANQGVASARNTGIEYSIKISSAFTAFLDSDDTWHPNCLSSEVVSHISTRQDIQIWGFDTLRANHRLTRYNVIKNTPYKELPGTLALWQFKGTFASAIYSTALLSYYHLRFPRKLKYSEDKVFLLKCLSCAQLTSKIPDVPMYIYRNNPHSVMKKVRSIRAIDYYTPIIDAWVCAEREVNLQKTSDCKQRFGEILAGIYLLDMATDHFKQWGSRKELRHALSLNPHFPLLSQLKSCDISTSQYRNRCLFLNHPLLFELKYRTIGIAENLMLLFYRIPFVYKLRDYKKYPFQWK